MEQNLFTYLRGSLRIQAEGPFLERFINLCFHRGIRVRNIRYLGSDRLHADVDLKSFKGVRNPAFRSQTHVRILQRNGLPFLLHRYKRRRLALVGVACFFVILWYTSTHIMGITIYGNSRIPTEQIEAALAERNIMVGETVRGIQKDPIRNHLMQELDDLAWVGINLSGSRIYVEIVERIDAEKRIDEATPCDLVATKDGVITKLAVREGQSVVKPGSGVRAGDVLASGMVDNETVGFRTVHAYGEVFARTVYQETAEYPLSYREAHPTGKEKNYYTLQVLDKTIPLYFKESSKYTEYEIHEGETEYRPPFDFLPSFFMTKKTYLETWSEPKTRTQKEAEALGKEELFQKLEEQIADDVQIEERKVESFLTEQGNVRVTATFTCIENIAVEAPMETDILPPEESPETT